MGDKTLLFLLIIFVVIGVFTYDQYVTEKSGESPIGKLLDYGGLAEEGKNSPRSLTTVSKFSTFQEGANSHLARLSKKLRTIEDQRLKLVQDRNAILVQLIELKDEALKEAEYFAEEINKEREEFLTYMPELQEISRLMAETYRIKNFKIRQEKYKEIKSKIAALNNNQSWGLSQADVDELNEFIKQTFVQKNLNYMAGCQTTEDCLQANVKQAQKFLGEVLIDSQQETNPGIVNAVKISQKTRKVFSDQMIYVDMNETFVNEQDEYYKGKFRDLILQLVQVTNQDLNDLIQLYQELQIEERNVLENIEVNSKRLSERFNDDRKQLENLMAKFDKARMEKFKTFFNILEKNKEDEAEYVKKVLDIDRQLVQMLGHRSFEDKLFLKNIAALIEVNIKRLVEDRVYAQKLNSAYIRFRTDVENRRRKVGIKDIYKNQPVDPEMVRKQNQNQTQTITHTTTQIKQSEPLRQTQGTPKTINARQKVNEPDLGRQKMKQQDTLKQFDKARSKAQDTGL